MPYIFRRDPKMFGFYRQSTDRYPYVYQYFSDEEWQDKRVGWSTLKHKYDPMSSDYVGYTVIKPDLGFSESDWIDELWDPIEKREIVNGMATWPDWPFERYTWVELAEIRASRSSYDYYEPPRLAAIMEEKYEAWRRQRKQGERAFAMVVYQRKFGEQEYRDKLARVVRRPELANADFFDGRRPLCLMVMGDAIA